MFLESFFQLAAQSIRDRDRIELPFGRGKTSPVAGADVAQVVAAVLADPIPHVGRIYELTGPQSQDMDGIAREFSEALNREITYTDISPEMWEQGLKTYKLPEHLMGHLYTVLAYLFFLTFIAHFGAILFHTLIVRDGMLDRMAPWRVRAG